MFLSLETLTSTIKTGLAILVELIDLVNSVISQMTLLRWLTFLLGFQTVILIVLLFWIYLSSDTRLCSTKAFFPLGNCDHVFVSVCIEFPSNPQQDALFHRIAYDYSCTGWDGLCDHLRDVPWEDIFKLGASAAACEFSDSKGKFRQASNRCKSVLEAAKLAYANKTKESITSQKLGSRDFWRIANSVPN